MSRRGNPGVLRGHLLPSLEQVRREKLLSRKALADQSGVDYVTLWRLESGKHGASPQTIERIAQALKVSEARLRRQSTPDVV